MSELSKDRILSAIAAIRKQRAAAIVVESTSNQEIYRPIEPDPISCFNNELESISGQCVLCEDLKDLQIKLKAILKEKGIDSLFCRDKEIETLIVGSKIHTTSNEDDFLKMKAGITSCEFLVARTGSVLVSSAGKSGRQMNVFPPIHIIVAHTSQILNYPEDALNAFSLRYGDELPSTITTITGPSRTADIEKTLVLGAHGPKELIVMLLKN